MCLLWLLFSSCLSSFDILKATEKGSFTLLNTSAYQLNSNGEKLSASNPQNRRGEYLDLFGHKTKLLAPGPKAMGA